MTIRERVAKSVGIPIGMGEWQEVFDSLDTSGKLTQRVYKDLFVVICQYLEEKENGNKETAVQSAER